MIKSINPATEEEIKSYTEMGKEEIDRIILNADKSFEQWKRVSFAQRANNMMEAGKLLRTNREKLSILKTFEMGKPIIQSCLLYTSPSPRDRTRSRMPSSA